MSREDLLQVSITNESNNSINTSENDFSDNESIPLSNSESSPNNAQTLLDKLDSVPVFTIADEQGSPLVASDENDGKVAGVFISQTDANEFINQLKTERSELADKVKVVPISLGKIYELSETAESQENAVNFAYVPEEEAVADANSVTEEYEGGVPLFVAKGGEENGYITIERDGQQVIPFFFDLAQLEEMIAKFEQQKPEQADTLSIEVLPLEGVIETLATSDDEMLEKVVLIPTEESIEFLQSADSNVNVYRFFNEDMGVHFYTSSEVEKDSIVANLPNYSLEGVSYEAVDPLTGADNSSVVHRFRNQNTGVHIYTIEEAERSFIANDLPNYEYEGEVFAAYTSQVEGTIPIHRFYNSELDTHFYTPSETEKESVENDLPNYDYEGIAYYAYPSDI